jgi:hypothetical protein
VLVDCNLVEVLAGVRVIREHVDWGHFPITKSEGWFGWKDSFSARVGRFAGTDQCGFPFRKTMIG